MGALTSVAGVGLNALLAKKAYDRRDDDSRDEVRRQVVDLRSANRAREDERRDRLRAALAKERARAGAAGVAVGGSSDAVLRGLTEEVDEDSRRDAAETEGTVEDLRRARLRNRRRNLLDLTERTVNASSSSTGFSLPRGSLIDL